MIESRCGLKCKESNCNEVYGIDCAGCVNIDKPFHGECSVKVCCESKKLKHCGVCTDFPCSLLKNFSYDKEHGDNGERIATCKWWADLEKIVFND